MEEKKWTLCDLKLETKNHQSAVSLRPSTLSTQILCEVSSVKYIHCSTLKAAMAIKLSHVVAVQAFLQRGTTQLFNGTAYDLTSHFL